MVQGAEVGATNLTKVMIVALAEEVSVVEFKSHVTPK